MKETLDKTPHSTNKRHIRAKLIFNPGAGTTGKSPVQLMDVISEMQAWKLVPEASWSNRVVICLGWSRRP